MTYLQIYELIKKKARETPTYFAYMDCNYEEAMQNNGAIKFAQSIVRRAERDEDDDEV